MGQIDMPKSLNTYALNGLMCFDVWSRVLVGECVGADPRGPRGTMRILRIDFWVRAAFYRRCRWKHIIVDSVRQLKSHVWNALRDNSLGPRCWRVSNV